ncbi:MAG: hypothetical protein ABF904_11645 [Ethanoligenens sp.]
MGNNTYIAYLMGRQLKSEEFRRAATEAPLDVLMDAYKRVAHGGVRGESYIGRMNALNRAMIERIMCDVSTDKQLKTALASAADKAAHMSLNQTDPIYVYAVGNRIGQGMQYPEGARWIIKCQKGKKYGYRPIVHDHANGNIDHE